MSDENSSYKTMFKILSYHYEEDEVDAGGTAVDGDCTLSVDANFTIAFLYAGVLYGILLIP